MDWNAALYSKSHGFVAEYGKNLLVCVPEDADQCILDFGCGASELTAAQAGKAAQMAGVDQSAAMIRVARETYPGPEYHVLDAVGIAPNPSPISPLRRHTAKSWKQRASRSGTLRTTAAPRPCPAAKLVSSSGWNSFSPRIWPVLNTRSKRASFAVWRSRLWDGERWIADYRRIRLPAVRD